MKVSEGGATTWILQQVIIALSIHGQEDIKGYSHTCLGSKLNIVQRYLAQYLGLQGLGLASNMSALCSHGHLTACQFGRECFLAEGNGVLQIIDSSLNTSHFVRRNNEDSMCTHLCSI